MLLSEKVFITDHAVDRFRERAIPAKQERYTDEQIKGLILGNLNIRNIRRMISYGEDRFIFTRNNMELRLEKEGKGWKICTIIKYRRAHGFDDVPIDFSKENCIPENYTIFTAMQVRAEQKRRYEEKGRTIKNEKMEQCVAGN